MLYKPIIYIDTSYCMCCHLLEAPGAVELVCWRREPGFSFIGFSFAYVCSFHDSLLFLCCHFVLVIFTVTTCLENREMSGNLTAVREMSGILLKIRELSGEKTCQGKVA